MNQESKKIKKSKRRPKNKTEQSKVVYCKIFSFLSTKDRLQCRFVSRSFNYFVIQSIESLNFEAMNSKMKSFKQFIGILQFILVKCTNLKYLIYPCLYKRVQMTSLVGKKRRPQIREISHITFTNYEQIAQLVTVNPGLRTLELNYDYHNGPVVLEDPLKDVFLNSMVEEIIIKRCDFSDVQLIVLMKDKITSLRILLHQDSNQLLEKLISLELNLKKLYLRLRLFDERTEENLNFFLSHQSNLEVLYLDCHKAMDLSNHKKLRTLILENIEEIKAIKFPQQPINKVIIKSLYITHKDIKFLLKNFSQFNILDLSSIQGCWMDILLAKNKCIIPLQTKKKRMNVYLNRNTFAKLDEIAKNAEVQLFQLEPIENLLNYYV